MNKKNNKNKKNDFKLDPNRDLPYDLDIEREILGNLIKNSDFLQSYIGELAPQYFFLVRHRLILETIQALYNDVGKVDILLLQEHLVRNNQLDELGGEEYLIELIDLVGLEENLEEYIRQLKIKFTLRELISFSRNVVEKGYDQEDVDVILGEVETFISNVGLELTEDECAPMEVMISEFLTMLDKKARADEDLGIPSGFATLDHMLGGFRKGDFNILAARPSVGKTALAMNIALNAANKKYPVLVFSLEMARSQLIERLVANIGHIESFRMQKGILSDSDLQVVMNSSGHLRKLPIYIDHSSDINPLIMKTRIKRLAGTIIKTIEAQKRDLIPEEKRDEPLALIVIDHLQLLHFPREKGFNFESREKEMAAISRMLKIIAKDMDVAVIALSQLSRASTKRESQSQRPQLADLRDSGALEQDADVVMLLHRPYAYDVGRKSKEKDEAPVDDKTRERETEIIVGKNRNGPTGVVPLVFMGEYFSFYEKQEYGENSSGT